QSGLRVRGGGEKGAERGSQEGRGWPERRRVRQSLGQGALRRQGLLRHRQPDHLSHAVLRGEGRGRDARDAALAASQLMTLALLVQSAIIGVSLGSIYILMALGLTLMFGMMHIINFAHGAVYMLGAFVIYYVFFQGGMPYFAAFVAAMLLLGVFGYLVE